MFNSVKQIIKEFLCDHMESDGNSAYRIITIPIKLEEKKNTPHRCMIKSNMFKSCRKCGKMVSICKRK